MPVTNSVSVASLATAAAAAFLTWSVDMPAMAAGLFPGSPPAQIVLYGDGALGISIEDSVSQVPTSRATVRKISGGRTKFVTITTTATGVYSNDAVVSKYVRYPGVHVQQLTPADTIAAVLSVGMGWVALPLVDAHSFVFLPPPAPATVED